MARYWGGDGGNRQFYIYVDNKKIAEESLTGGKSEFINVEYAIPDSLLEDKTSIRVKFRAKSGNTAGGVYYLRLLMPESSLGVSTITVDKTTALKGVYTLGGVKVQGTSTLPKGIYIVDGRKYAVR